MSVLSVVGSFTSIEYQEARLIAEDIIPLTLSTASPLALHLRPLTYYQWQSFVAGLPPLPCRPSPSHPVLLHSVLGYLGTTAELIDWAARTYGYIDSRPTRPATVASLQAELTRLAQHELSAYIEQQQSRSAFQYAYLDVEVDARHAGSKAAPARHRLIMELYPAIAPRAVHNFLSLCQSFPTSSLPSPPSVAFPPSLHYLDCPIHRVVPHSFLQSGDILHGHGDLSCSIYGPSFPDESFAIRHATPGVLSMVADGQHGNGSQFIVTLAARPEFDGRLVAFGRVVGGEELIDRCNNAVRVDGRIGHEGVSAVQGIVLRHERPLYPIRIAQCDVFTLELLDDSFASWTKPSLSVVPSRAPSRPSTAGPALAITVLVIGPLAAGKTTLINAWCGAGDSIPTPTTGFELHSLQLPPASPSSSSIQLTFYGLGGADNIRGYWPNYYDGAHGIVFVVDPARPPPAALLEEVKGHPMVQGKPLLLLINSRGGEGTAEAAEVGVVSTDLKGGEGQEARHALGWLVSEVRQRWDELDIRVQRDVQERKRQTREERDRRKEQIDRDKAEEERARQAKLVAEEEKTCA